MPVAFAPMTDWQERITRQTPPAIRVEHYARYRLVAPLVGRSETWCDLGCGNGLAATAGLDGARPERARGVDVVLSVPNDAFWAIQNPHHQTMWSEGAFEELRRLLPESAVVMRQVALAGSAVVPLDSEGEGRADLQDSVVVDAAAAV